MYKLFYTHINEPLEHRGDVQTLKQYFNADQNIIKFVYAWAIREPTLVHAYCRGAFELAKQTKTKYTYLPNRLIKYMKPEVAERWPRQEVVRLGYVLMYHDYKAATKAASKLPGTGVYSKEHLYRTWLVIREKQHPSQQFIAMGQGADYNLLRENGIKCMVQFKERARIILGIALSTEVVPRYLSEMDAGQLAYLICMSHF